VRARGACLYFFKGQRSPWADQRVAGHAVVEVRGRCRTVELSTASTESEFLVLQGRPIGEPVAQYGPFVMNTQAEIMQAMQDYRRTQFGGWPWPDDAPVHGRDPARFARHPDGRVERPTTDVETTGTI
jgi:hypothetical protein